MGMTQADRAVINLVINGQQAQASLKEVTLATSRLRSEMLKLKEADNPELYKAKLAELNKLNAAQSEMASRLRVTTTAWQRFKKEMGTVAMGVVGGNVITFALQQLVSLIPDTIDRTMKLKDAFADIEKTTGMSTEQVKKFNKELKAIDTRTTGEELRNITIVGGQLGVANSQLLDFVKNTDKAVVALGDEFTGGAEEVGKTFGGIAKLYKETKDMNIGSAINNIGSAVNELGAAGAATGPVITDFTTRMGQLGQLAPSLNMTLALGASLQELGLTADIASSGLSGIMLTASNQSALFAQQLQMTKQQVEQLINTNPDEFLRRLARSFQGLTATQVAQQLKALKVESQESVKVMSLLSENTELVEEKFRLTSKAMAEGTSLTNEFNKKNHQLARDLKDLKEWFNSLLTSEGLQNFLVNATHSAVEFTKTLSQLGPWLTRNKEWLYLFMAATVAYYGATLKATAITIANTTAEIARKVAFEAGYRWLIISEVASKAYALATGVLTGQITLQTAAVTLARTAWAGLTAIMYANPIGVVVAAVAALAYAVKTYSDNTERALAVERENNRIKREGQLLVERHTKLLQQFNEQVATYSQLSIQERAELVKGLAMGKLELEMRLQRYKLRVKENELLAQEPSLWQQLWTAMKNGPNVMGYMLQLKKEAIANMQAVREQAAPTIQSMEQGIAAYQQQLDQITRMERQAARPAAGSITPQTITDPDKKPKKDPKTEQEKDEDKLKKLLEKERLEAIEAQKGEYARQVQALNEKYDEMVRLAHGNAEQLKEIERLKLINLADLNKKHDAETLRQIEEQQKAVAEAAIRANQEAMQGKMLDIRGKEVGGSLSPEQAEQERLRTEFAFLMAELLMREQFAQQTAEVEQKLTDNLIAQQALRRQTVELSAERQRDSYRMMHEFIQQTSQMTLGLLKQNWTDVISGYKNYWKQATLVQKAALIAEKAYALAQIAISLQRQLAAVNIAASMADALLPGAGIPVRIKGYATAIGGAALQTAKVVAVGINTPGFMDGGYTTDSTGKPGGYYQTPTFFSSKNYTVSEDGKPEFVISNRALQVPVIADFARLVNSVQKSGNYSAITQASSPGGGVDLMPLLAEIRAMRQDMNALQNRPVKAQLNYHAWRDETDRVMEIEHDTSLG